MQFIRGIHNLTAKHQPSVVSIGNYDGVHLGHQHVIKTLIQHSAQLKAPSTVITFDPLAKEFFMPESAVRLSSVEQRAQQLFDLGVDRVLCIEFNAEFAANSPLEFVEEILINSLGVRYLCVGDDFRFGKDRAGDFEFLKVCGADFGFSVEAHATFTVGGERVSSGRVRDALKAGDFVLAEQLLGRAYSISGTVSRGQQIGRTLNYPTANIVLDATRYAVSGVYAVRVRGAASHIVEGVANVGTRPTVDGNENRLEVHLFDFDADIYGAELEVQFCRKLRDEQKFSTIESLKQQIIADAAAARAYFREQGA